MDLLWLALCSGRHGVRHSCLQSLLLKSMQHGQSLPSALEKNKVHGFVVNVTMGLLRDLDLQFSAGELAIGRTSSTFESVSCVM